MDATYYIRLRNAVTGPFTLEALQQMANSGKVSRMHQFSSDGIHWQSANSCPEIFAAGSVAVQQLPAASSEKLVDTVKVATDTDPSSSTNIEVEWYVLLHEERQGPFTKLQIENFLESDDLTLESFVWCSGMADWQRIQETEPFQSKAADSSPVKSNVPEAPPRTAVLSDGTRPELSIIGVASVVFAVLWMFGFGSLAGMVLGGLSLYQIEKSEGRVRGRGFAMIGLAVGLIGALATTIAWCMFHATSNTVQVP